VGGPSKKDRIAADDKIARIRLLNAEMDNVRQASVDRTRSIDSKSSFAIVVAGVVAGAACVSRVYTEQAVFAVGPAGVTVLERFGVTLDELRDVTALQLEEEE
jgi:acyl CoA:acetate/3-ketoacid CoA transferase beta subunit